MTDALHGLVARLRALDDEAVSGHPAVLEEIHRGLVSELDALAGAGSNGDRRPERA